MAAQGVENRVSRENPEMEQTGERHRESGEEKHPGDQENRTGTTSLGQKASEFAGDVKQRAGDTWEGVKEAGREMKNQAADDLHEWKDEASEYLEQGKDQVRALFDTFEGQIRSQPLTCVCVALAVGFMCGTAWCRR